MVLTRRPDTEKAELVDNLARLGGDDYRFWDEDGRDPRVLLNFNYFDD